MAYKIRKNLADKMEAAFQAAAKKEGLEITEKILPDGGLKPREIVYRCKDGYLLKDGRYVTRRWNIQNNSYLLIVMDNLPANILRFLVRGDHDESTQDRAKDDHEDFRYQDFLKKDGKGTPNAVNPIDRYASDTNFGNPEDIVIRKMCDSKKKALPVIDLTKLGTDPYLGFTPSGRFDEETKEQIKAIAHAFIKGLPPQKRADCLWLFSSNLMQKDLAEAEGHTEAAISKRKNKYADMLAAIFREHGFPVLTKEEKKEEAKRRRKYRKHFENDSRAIKKEYFPKEADETETFFS